MKPLLWYSAYHANRDYLDCQIKGEPTEGVELYYHGKTLVICIGLRLYKSAQQEQFSCGTTPEVLYLNSYGQILLL